MALQSTTALATITLQSAASEIVFSGIPNTYRDLTFAVSILGTTNDQSCVMQLNGDTGANYSNIRMAGWGASTGSNTTGSNYIFVSGYNYGVATSGAFTVAQGFLLDYATTKNKATVIRSRSSRDDGNTDTALGTGRWASSSAVTSIRFYLTSGNFAAGSTFSLYGRVS